MEALFERDPNVKLYGVSTGNGNDGISHMFPDYYVWTDKPWRLARCATIELFNGAAGKQWAAGAMMVDGEAEFGIQACIFDPPLEPGEEAPKEGESWCDANGAWLLLDVFPIDEDEGPRVGKPIYDSIEDTISPSTLAMVTEDE